MPLPIFDLVLLFIIGGFGLFGLWSGLISALGSLLGSILGVFLATRYYEPLAVKLMAFTGWTGNFSKVVMFIIAFLIINRLVGFVFYLAAKLLHVITHLPFIHGIDKILGLVFGLAEGIIVLGITLFFYQKFPFWTYLTEQIKISHVVPYCVGVGKVLWPLIPEGVKFMQANIGSK